MDKLDELQEYRIPEIQFSLLGVLVFLLGVIGPIIFISSLLIAGTLTGGFK